MSPKRLSAATVLAPYCGNSWTFRRELRCQQIEVTARSKRQRHKQQRQLTNVDHGWREIKRRPGAAARRQRHATGTLSSFQTPTGPQQAPVINPARAATTAYFRPSIRHQHTTTARRRGKWYQRPDAGGNIAARRSGWIRQQQSVRP